MPEKKKAPVCPECWGDVVYDSRKPDSYRPAHGSEPCARCQKAAK